MTRLAYYGVHDVETRYLVLGSTLKQTGKAMSDVTDSSTTLYNIQATVELD